MAKGYFITGTDTDVGKTWVSLGLLTLLNNAGYSTTVMKPVSAGCKQTPEGLRNDDAIELIKHATVKPAYGSVNPYAFEAAIAPHIAAQNEGTDINIATITKLFDDISQKADFTIVEGAGGWKVPINATQTMADMAKAFELPVILVVGMKLGCLNHAILTVDSMLNKEIEIAGWVANSLNPYFEEQLANTDTLKSLLPTPFLGSIPYLKTKDLYLVAERLNL
ncbi:MAG: dethiobiotin synthase [Gammaproteobacteria bacterium]|nr:dethiobiotin synthase [Gammaproteobacteria bacterium]